MYNVRILEKISVLFTVLYAEKCEAAFNFLVKCSYVVASIEIQMYSNTELFIPISYVGDISQVILKSIFAVDLCY